MRWENYHKRTNFSSKVSIQTTKEKWLEKEKKACMVNQIRSRRAYLKNSYN